MKVFKFGGASVNSIDRIKQVAAILRVIRRGPVAGGDLSYGQNDQRA